MLLFPSATHVSKSLTWAELACKDHLDTPYPNFWAERAFVLADCFETLREFCGDQPILVLSGFRTPAHNKRIGGARDSQHLYGRALDLQHSFLSNDDFRDRILDYLKDHPESPIRGLGEYPTFVHIDIRSHDRLVRWKGSRRVADRRCAW